MHFRDLDTDPSPKTMQEEARETNLSLGGAHKRPGGSSLAETTFAFLDCLLDSSLDESLKNLFRKVEAGTFLFASVAMCVLAVAAR